MWSFCSQNSTHFLADNSIPDILHHKIMTLCLKQNSLITAASRQWISYRTGIHHSTHSSGHYLYHSVGKWERDLKILKLRVIPSWKTTGSSHWLHLGQDFTIHKVMTCAFILCWHVILHHADKLLKGFRRIWQNCDIQQQFHVLVLLTQSPLTAALTCKLTPPWIELKETTLRAGSGRSNPHCSQW